jgi:hypothetical protein
MIAAFIAQSTTGEAIWIGTASTLIVAGLVDGSAQWETQLQERMVLRLVAERIAKFHLAYLLLLLGVFGEAPDLPLPAQVTINFDAPVAGFMPRRTVAQHVRSQLREMDANLEAAIALSCLTSAASQCAQIGDALGSSSFIATLRYGPPFMPGGFRLARPRSLAMCDGTDVETLMEAISTKVSRFDRYRVGRGGPLVVGQYESNPESLIASPID